MFLFHEKFEEEMQESNNSIEISNYNLRSGTHTHTSVVSDNVCATSTSSTIDKKGPTERSSDLINMYELNWNETYHLISN